MTKTEAAEVLGVQVDASRDEVRRAWRRVAATRHSDRPDGDAEEYRRAVEAYGVLTGRLEESEAGSSRSTDWKAWLEHVAAEMAEAIPEMKETVERIASAEPELLRARDSLTTARQSKGLGRLFAGFDALEAGLAAVRKIRRG